MKDSMFNLNITYHGHFGRRARIEVRGDHQQMDKHVVVISLIEEPYAGEIMESGALHIYLSRSEAKALSDALFGAADLTPVGE